MTQAIGITIKAAQAGFFDRAAVIAAVDKAELPALMKSANAIKQISQRSMRPARQRRIADMSRRDLIQYRAQLKRFKTGERKTKPKRGYVASQPGEPPRTRESRKLRLFLFASYDTVTKSTVIGPAKLNASKNGTAPSALEAGGTTDYHGRTVAIRPRPFMKPALAKEQTNIAKRWENAIKK